MLRSLKTLALRLERHCANALNVARWLKTHPKVTAVYYPGLEEHPGHELSKRQANGFGGMLSFRVDSAETARQVLKKLKLISFAESLGGVESLMTLPAVQTHADIPESERLRLGICERLLRFVITSYSIHYTKLYDVRLVRGPERRRAVQEPRGPQHRLPGQHQPRLPKG